MAGIFRFSSILNSITHLKHSKNVFLRAPYRQDKKTLSVILTMKNIRNKLSLDHFVISLLHQIHHFHKKHTKKTSFSTLHGLLTPDLLLHFSSKMESKLLANKYGNNTIIFNTTRKLSVNEIATSRNRKN